MWFCDIKLLKKIKQDPVVISLRQEENGDKKGGLTTGFKNMISVNTLRSFDEIIDLKGEYIKSLTALQAKVPPVSWENIENIIKGRGLQSFDKGTEMTVDASFEHWPTEILDQIVSLAKPELSGKKENYSTRMASGYQTD